MPGVSLILRRQFFAIFPVLGLLLGRRSADPFDDPEWLTRWKQAPRLPIWQSSDPTVDRLLRAVRDERSLDIRYFSGSGPGALRRVTPGLVFRSEGFQGIWLSGVCHNRKAEKAFRVDQIVIEAIHLPRA